MRRVPVVAAAVSLEEAEGEHSGFSNGQWSPVNLSSLPSINFSELSHPAYDEQSTFLSSVAEGASTLVSPSSAIQRVSGGSDGVAVEHGVRCSRKRRENTVINVSVAEASSPSTRLPVVPDGARCLSRLMLLDEVAVVPSMSDLHVDSFSTLRLMKCMSGDTLFQQVEEENVEEEELSGAAVAMADGNVSPPGGRCTVSEGGTTVEVTRLPPVLPAVRSQRASCSLPVLGNAGDSETRLKKRYSAETRRSIRKQPAGMCQLRHRGLTIFSSLEECSEGKDVSSVDTMWLEGTALLVAQPATCQSPSPAGRRMGDPPLVSHEIAVAQREAGATQAESNGVFSPSDAGVVLGLSDEEPSLNAAVHNVGETLPQSSVCERPHRESLTSRGTLPADKETARDVAANGEADHVKTPALQVGRCRCSLGGTFGPPERVVRLLESVSDPDLLVLIREYIAQRCQSQGICALVELCDAYLKGGKCSTITHRMAHSSNAAASATEKEEGGECSLLEDGTQLDEDGVDEFDDINIRETPYPAKDPRERYSFSSPSQQGVITSVCRSKILYKIITENGGCFFFNDTLQYVMVVRLRCSLTGSEVINEKAIQLPLENGETELTLAVLPEDTMFLIQGLEKIPRVLVKGVAPPRNFVPPSVSRNMQAVGSSIQKVRSMLGRFSHASDQKAFLNCCMNHRLKFIDLEFRPSAGSLWRSDVDVVKVAPLTWRRPAEFLLLTEVSEARLFRREISCHLVRQGSLDDHTVVAGIAAVALFPSHVRWLFRHPVSAATGKRERAVGAYRVTLCTNGWWTTLLLDDYFPASLKTPLFARCPRDPRRLWVPLLEKAYAKSLGSYAALCVADALEVLTDFTGYPCRHLDDMWAAAVEDPDMAKSLYNYIYRSAKSHFIIMVYTPSPKRPQSASSIDTLRRLSLRLGESGESTPLFLPGHVYFITEALYCEELNLRMVRLKNPWTWRATGKPCLEKRLKASKWLEQPENSISLLSTTLASHGRRAVSEEERGTMWLEWSEALNTFAGGGVCYTLWSWSDYRIRNCFRNGIPEVVLRVRVTAKLEAILSVSQESRLGHTTAPETSCYDAVMLLVSRHAAATNMECVAYKSCDDMEARSGRLTYHEARDVSLKCVFEPRYSPYYIIPRVHDKYIRKLTPFVISVLCNKTLGGPEAEVAFCHCDASCQVFCDAASFSTSDQVCTPVAASYQRRTAEGVSLHKGPCITV